MARRSFFKAYTEKDVSCGLLSLLRELLTEPNTGGTLVPKCHKSTGVVSSTKYIPRRYHEASEDELSDGRSSSAENFHRKSSDKARHRRPSNTEENSRTSIDGSNSWRMSNGSESKDVRRHAEPSSTSKHAASYKPPRFFPDIPEMIQIKRSQATHDPNHGVEDVLQTSSPLKELVEELNSNEHSGQNGYVNYYKNNMGKEEETVKKELARVQVPVPTSSPSFKPYSSEEMDILEPLERKLTQTISRSQTPKYLVKYKDLKKWAPNKFKQLEYHNERKESDGKRKYHPLDKKKSSSKKVISSKKRNSRSSLSSISQLEVKKGVGSSSKPKRQEPKPGNRYTNANSKNLTQIDYPDHWVEANPKLRLEKFKSRMTKIRPPEEPADFRAKAQPKPAANSTKNEWENSLNTIKKNTWPVSKEAKVDWTTSEIQRETENRGYRTRGYQATNKIQKQSLPVTSDSQTQNQTMNELDHIFEQSKLTKRKSTRAINSVVNYFKGNQSKRVHPGSPGKKSETKKKWTIARDDSPRRPLSLSLDGKSSEIEDLLEGDCVSKISDSLYRKMNNALKKVPSKSSVWYDQFKTRPKKKDQTKKPTNLTGHETLGVEEQVGGGSPSGVSEVQTPVVSRRMMSDVLADSRKMAKSDIRLLKKANRTLALKTPSRSRIKSEVKNPYSQSVTSRKKSSSAPFSVSARSPGAWSHWIKWINRNDLSDEVYPIPPPDNCNPFGAVFRNRSTYGKSPLRLSDLISPTNPPPKPAPKKEAKSFAVALNSSNASDQCESCIAEIVDQSTGSNQIPCEGENHAASEWMNTVSNFHLPRLSPMFMCNLLSPDLLNSKKSA